MPGKVRQGAIAERIRACWRFKLLLTILLNLFFWIGYGYLAHHTFFPVWTPPMTWVDHWVPFQPQPWSMIYLSEFIFTLVVPWLVTSQAELRRYAVGLLFLSGASFLLFLFVPVASPRPPAIAAEGWHGFIVKWDGPYNAFPSLHAGFLVYTLLLARRTFHLNDRFLWFWPVVLFWAGLVMVSTLATRQHYVVDLVAGASLGWMAHAFCGSELIQRSGRSVARITLRKNGKTSQAGSK